jgi:uncharacterized SAM-binding protein YcdF (DUF218 family)
MIFLFKKIMTPLLMPVTLGLEIAFLGLFLLWFTKKQRTGKLLVTLGLGLVLILGHNLVADPLISSLEKGYPPDQIQLEPINPSPHLKLSIKYIVILGGGHASDPALPLTSQVSAESLRRLIEGIQLYHRLPETKLIVSGGAIFDSMPHAELMFRLASDLGVPLTDIIVESRPKDTKDEARFIRPIVGGQPFFLVTDASHMRRSVALFRHLNMNPIPAPTGHSVRLDSQLTPSDFFPNADNLKKSEKAFHEYLGLLWARLRGQI